MLQPRDTDALESAVEEVIALLGAKEAAHVIGKSTSLIYDAASDTSAFMLKWEDRLALDAACFERHGAAPFHRWWGRQLAKRADGSSRECEDLMEATLDVGSAVGRLDDAVRHCRRPESDGGHKITPRERIHIKAATKRVRDELDDVDRAVDAEFDAVQLVHDFEGRRARERAG